MADLIYGVGSYGTDSYASDKVNLIGITSLYIGCHPNSGFEANGIFDEVQLFNADKTDAEITALFNATQPSTWANDHMLLAHLDKNVAGGNLIVENLNITNWRIYRKRAIDNQYKLVKSIPNTQNTFNKFIDYGVANNFAYDYAIEGSSIEGVSAKFEQTNEKLNFNGIWLIDTDTDESLQLKYNLNELTLNVESDITEIKTFSQFPLIRKGIYNTKRGSISCDLYDSNPTTNKDISNLYQQLEKLERIIKSSNLLIKIDTGDIFYASVSNLSYTRNPDTNRLINIKFDFIQIGVI